MISRRGFLGLLGGAGLTVAGCGALAPEVAGESLTSALPLPARFTVPLPIPATAVPVRPGHYEVVQRAAKVEIIPGTTTEIWGYDGTFPGPTFHLDSGGRTVIRVRNELPVPTSTHLHGGVTPSQSDGYPTDVVIAEGRGFRPPQGDHSHDDLSQWTLHEAARDYVYPLEQRAATLWYHDHRMDFTAPQVWRGLAGFLVVRDDEDDALPLPKGERDIPLMICDRAFEEDGSFRYPSLDPTLLMRPGVDDAFMAGVEGDVILVNGAPWPFLEVDAVRYRLRLLNASNARRFRLRLTPGGRFVQVGSDQGLLTAPLAHDAITISPGERFDVIVDFSGRPAGTEVTMVNTLGAGAARDVMRFRVRRGAADDSVIPKRLSPAGPVPTAVATRVFDFRRTGQRGGGSWTINGRRFRPGRPLATPRLDTSEIWRFTSDFHHPVHVHLARFRVLSRNGGPAAATDAGWKDTVDVRPYEVVDVLVRFEGYRGRYMLHCHNLEHEDMAMMADFEVV
ncbi:Multicopper oxidase with three cupredoxin domains (includes cell division protein FtsP and spore coat protein CotA) [Microbispora rosea]|uniref:Multicopper oxidase CueO n=1 Tax=Microbispora rosea TaxID=58117 RepID=A0A1N7FQ73_9ACTN|nr:multicopper oxidase domain-containing protein [Microbispora rosea]GIH50794.1 spore coat protein A [Microbispora rosea subsp. rosea]SIS02489.1 Multicopper oxidase with three cupredoxin domains (includes cell division protein FtsP and spore coat protein CotA) [Microbispora rosea]